MVIEKLELVRVHTSIPGKKIDMLGIGINKISEHPRLLMIVPR
jgi:hypothetical protein